MRSSRRGIAHAAAGRARGGRSIGIRILDVKISGRPMNYFIYLTLSPPRRMPIARPSEVRPHIERALWRLRTASEMHPTYLARPLRGLAAVRTNRTTYFFRAACRLQESRPRHPFDSSASRTRVRLPLSFTAVMGTRKPTHSYASNAEGNRDPPY